MNNTSLESKFFIKHVLSSEWISARYISEDDQYIKFVIEDTDNTYFEKNDKIVYSIKSKSKNHSYNTVVFDVDYPTYDKITLILEKPLERRLERRHNINLSCFYRVKDDEKKSLIVDISRTGFKMLENTKFELRDEFDLNIVIEDTEILNCVCKVVYRVGNKEYYDDYKYVYGLKIVKISKQDKSLLNDFIDNLE